MRADLRRDVATKVVTHQHDARRYMLLLYGQSGDSALSTQKLSRVKLRGREVEKSRQRPFGVKY